MFMISTGRYGGLRGTLDGQGLNETATTEDFLAVQTEGKRWVSRRLKYHTLDATILAVILIDKATCAKFAHIQLKER